MCFGSPFPVKCNLRPCVSDKAPQRDPYYFFFFFSFHPIFEVSVMHYEDGTIILKQESELSHQNGECAANHTHMLLSSVL